MGQEEVDGARIARAMPHNPLPPAYYASRAGGWRRDVWAVLHPPYTAWHLSYVVIGASLASSLSVMRLVATLLAFFLAVGISAHALDELRGRPLQTEIPGSVLWAAAVIGLAGAVGLGVAGVPIIGLGLLPFIALGVLFVFAYNLELLGGRLHGDFWFALSWGIVGLTSGVSSVLLALGHPYASARLQWTRNAGFALTIFPVAYIFRDLQAIVITRFLVTLVVSPTLFYALSRVLEVPIRDFAMALWRPMMAGAVMAVAVLALNAELAFRGPPRLFLDMVLGAVTYGATLMVLWTLAGRPGGPERLMWEWAPLAPLRWRLVAQAVDS